MSNKLIIILVYVSICFSSNAQSIKKISENRKEKFTNNYYQKEYSNDTIIIVFDTNQSSTSLIEDVHFKNEYNFRYFKYSRKYPNLNSCVLLEFYHMAGPHQGHEEYLINKRRVIKKKYQILFDQKHDFIFWHKNASKLESRTLLFVDQTAWESKKNIIKGVGVQISVFGSCDDLIEKNQQLYIYNQLRRGSTGIPKDFYRALAWGGLKDEDVRAWNTKSAGFFYFSAAAELEKKGSCRVIVFAEAEENWEIPWVDSCMVGRRLF